MGLIDIRGSFGLPFAKKEKEKNINPIKSHSNRPASFFYFILICFSSLNKSSKVHDIPVVVMRASEYEYYRPPDVPRPEVPTLQNKNAKV